MMPVLGKSRVFVEGGKHNTDEDANKNDENVSTVFSLLLTVMKICGILFIHADGNCKTRREILIVHVVYCLSIQTIAFLNALRYILVFVSEGTRWQCHIAVLSFAWFYFVIVYFGIMCLFCCKHMTKFFTSFGQYHIDHGIHFDIKKYKRNIRIMAIVLFVEITIASIGLPGTIIFGEIPAESLYGMILWPMHTASGSLLIIAGVSYAVVSLFALTSCLSMVMFYLFVLACIKKELQYISSSLADLRHKEVRNITTGLEDIRQQHQSIVNLLSSVNPILQHVVGGFYVMGIPIICCMLHGLSSGTISLDDLYRMIFTILGNIVGMFVLTFKGADINSEVCILTLVKRKLP
jgi:hypothetical protein